MLEVITTKKSIEVVFSSSGSEMGRTIDHCICFLKERDCSNWVNASIVIRELLCNAIEHGNDLDPTLFATIRIVLKPEPFILIEVEDEGQGFDKNIIMAGIQQKSCFASKRGLKLIHEHTRNVKFNETGNKVSATVDFHGTPRELLTE